MDQITVSGIVLTVMPIGEYDRRIELLTSELGRISAFARGARRPNSALVSASNTFAFGQFMLYRGKDSYTLTQAKISDYFIELSKNVEHTYYGFYFLELARYFTRENAPAADELHLLYNSLRALLLDSLDNRLVRAVYEIKLLNLSGLSPANERLWGAEGSFSFAKGLSASCLYTYKFVTASEIGNIYTFSLSDDTLKEFIYLAARLIQMNVDRPLKTAKLIDKLSFNV